MNSLRSQLILIALLFFVFSAGVILQIAYMQVFQNRQIRQLEEGHQIIGDYLRLEAMESEIITSLKNACDALHSSVLPHTDLDAINSSLRSRLRKLVEWQRKYLDWGTSDGDLNQQSAFQKKLIVAARRQASAYRKVVDLIRQQKKREAEIVLAIEQNYLPSTHQVVRSILIRISDQRQQDINLSHRFFISTIFAVLVTFGVLIVLSTYSFGAVTRNLKRLSKGANSISTGNLGETINVRGPKEFSDLAASFNTMQRALKEREVQIRAHGREIEDLNRSLEDRVAESAKKIEKQNQILSHKNKELEQVLYTASHDLRTPLISIQGFSEELKFHCDTLLTEFHNLPDSSNADVKQMLEKDIPLSVDYIRNGAKRIEILLDGLLRITRLGRVSLNLDLLDMNDLIKNVINAVQFQLQEAKATVNVGELCECRGDSSLLHQVFSNLITNAIKYRDPDRDCIIDIKSEIIDGETRYHIEDNGIGIAPEYFDKIFNAFYRINNDGIAGDGLGLAIVNRIVEMHNGELEVQSDGEQGSHFTVRIPSKSSADL